MRVALGIGAEGGGGVSPNVFILWDKGFLLFGLPMYILQCLNNQFWNFRFFTFGG
jgi:hypothetical protein